jgi:hypothetical protein
MQAVAGDEMMVTELQLLLTLKVYHLVPVVRSTRYRIDRCMWHLTPTR